MGLKTRRGRVIGMGGAARTGFSGARHKKRPAGVLAGLLRWWSRGESNPRPQVLYRQIYILIRPIWI